MQNLYVVIVAGGSGVRMGNAIPKQFLLLQHKSILEHSVAAFLQTLPSIQVIVVLPTEHMSNGKELLQALQPLKPIIFTEGGVTRFNSVKNGLQYVKPNGIVFVHDAVRCLVDEKLILNCLHQALEKGSAIPAVTATDSIRVIDEIGNNTVYDRTKVYIVQTPQTFACSILLNAFEQPYQPLFTDEATVVEATGQSVHLVEGSYNNIKITRPLDLLIAEHIIKERS